MPESADVVVVGAGPAGAAAALTCARRGLATILLERAQRPGEHGEWGTALPEVHVQALVPGRVAEALPIERRVIEQRLLLTGPTGALAIGARDAATASGWFTVTRQRFDAWLAERATEAGATLVCGAAASEPLCEGDQVAGVRTDDGRTFTAKLVILADGPGSRVLAALGRAPSVRDNEKLQLAAQAYEVSAGVLGARFCLGPKEGVVIEICGEAFGGIDGRAWLLTQEAGLTLGASAPTAALMAGGIDAPALLDRVAAHPQVAPLLVEAQPLTRVGFEVPDPAAIELPEHHGDGWLACGDAAFCAHALHREGAAIALLSGRLAGEAALGCFSDGRFDRRFTALYARKIAESPIPRALAKYRKMARVTRRQPSLSRYAPLLAAFARDALATDDTDAGARQQRASSAFVDGAGGLAAVLKDAFSVWRIFG